MGGNMSVSFSFSIRVRLSWYRAPTPADPNSDSLAAAGDPAASPGLRPPQIRDLPALLLPRKPTPLPAATAGGCTICLEHFAGGQEVRILPRCRHAYHRPCIDRWLLRSGHCPVCRDRPVHPGLASIVEATMM